MILGDTHLGQYQLDRTYTRAKRNGKYDVARRAALAPLIMDIKWGQVPFKGEIMSRIDIWMR